MGDSIPAGHGTQCACGHQITAVRIDRNGHEYLFTTCSHCGFKQWTEEGAEVELDHVLVGIEEPRRSEPRQAPRRVAQPPMQVAAPPQRELITAAGLDDLPLIDIDLIADIRERFVIS